MQSPINKTQRRLLISEAGKTGKMTKFSKNLKKCEFCPKKVAKICDIQKLKSIPWQLKIFY